VVFDAVGAICNMIDGNIHENPFVEIDEKLWKMVSLEQEFDQIFGIGFSSQRENLFNNMLWQDFRNFPLCYHFRMRGTVKYHDFDDVERQLIFHLKLFFFFKVNVKEAEIKQFFLRADFESRNNQQLEAWLRNLPVGAVSQYEWSRKTTYWEFTGAEAKIVRSLEPGVSFDSEKAYDDPDLQNNGSIL
jgi:hypothetical protein